MSGLPLDEALSNLEAKARRLLVEGRVRVFIHKQGKLCAIVKGDTGTYTVTILRSGNAICPCPARLRCAHLIAVERVTRERA